MAEVRIIHIEGTLLMGHYLGNKIISEQKFSKQWNIRDFFIFWGNPENNSLTTILMEHFLRNSFEVVIIERTLSTLLGETIISEPYSMNIS